VETELVPLIGLLSSPSPNAHPASILFLVFLATLTRYASAAGTIPTAMGSENSEQQAGWVSLSMGGRDILVLYSLCLYLFIHVERQSCRYYDCIDTHTLGTDTSTYQVLDAELSDEEISTEYKLVEDELETSRVKPMPADGGPRLKRYASSDARRASASCSVCESVSHDYVKCLLLV